MIKDYGYVQPTITQDQYNVLGSSPITDDVVEPTGDWSKSLPVYEPQYNAFFDSFGCTVFGGLNQIETYLKKTEGVEYNFSERFIYILAQITPPGANPHDVYEVIRKCGLIDNSFLPMVETYKDFLRPNPMSTSFLKKGKEFTEDFDFKHEWLWGNKLSGRDSLEIKKALIKEYLKSSPIAVSVTAWDKHKGEYVDKGMPNTHWCLAFKIDAKDRIHVFDSYDQSIKILSADHNIEFAKRISITRKELTQTRFTYLMELLYSLLPRLWKH